MSNNAGSPEARRQQLSALMDGESDPQIGQEILAAWRNEAETRSTWHSYQLLGDVMRSGDLAQPAAHDQAFLQALRARLDAEPVPLATTPMLPAFPVEQVPAARAAHAAVGLSASADTAPAVSGARARRVRARWASPVAMAAGVAAVAGVVLAVRSVQPTAGEGPQLAKFSPPAASQPEVAGRGLVMVRDAGLDRYLSAHRNQVDTRDWLRFNPAQSATPTSSTARPDRP